MAAATAEAVEVVRPVGVDIREDNSIFEAPASFEPAGQAAPRRIRLRAPGGAPEPETLGQSQAAGKRTETRFDELLRAPVRSPQELLDTASARLEKAQDAGNESEEAVALLAVADATLAKEEAEDGLRAASEALSLLRELGDKEGEATALHIVAKAHFLRGAHPSAAALSWESVEVFRQLRHAFGEAASLELIGRAKQASDPVGALRAAKEACALFEGLGEERLAAMAQGTIVSAHLQRGHVEDALPLAMQLLTSFQRLGDKRNEGEIMLLVAQAHEIRKRWADKSKEDAVVDDTEGRAEVNAEAELEEEMRWRGEAARIFREIKDRRSEANALVILAEARLKRGEPGDGKAGLEAAVEARKLFRELSGDEAGSPFAAKEVRCLHLQVAGLCKKGEQEEALKLAKKAVADFEEREERICAAQALLEVVNVHAARGQPKDVRRAALEARAAFQEVANWEGEVDVLRCVMSSHFREQSPNEALAVAQEIVAIFNREGEKHKEARLLLEIAEIYVRRRMPQKAMKAAAPALAVFEEIGDAPNVRNVKQMIRSAEALKAQMKEAMKWAKETMKQNPDDPEATYGAALAVYEARKNFFTGGKGMPAKGPDPGGQNPKEEAPMKTLPSGPSSSNPIASKEGEPPPTDAVLWALGQNPKGKVVKRADGSCEFIPPGSKMHPEAVVTRTGNESGWTSGKGLDPLGRKVKSQAIPDSQYLDFI
mmetsp:Transcript_19316/g.41015  ORF Transcript_19316/g.41015 Transcript_19316/m.41015 type:complete len:714 (-) Transcript_19316:171-2312(-)